MLISCKDANVISKFKREMTVYFEMKDMGKSMKS